MVCKMPGLFIECQKETLRYEIFNISHIPLTSSWIPTKQCIFKTQIKKEGRIFLQYL